MNAFERMMANIFNTLNLSVLCLVTPLLLYFCIGCVCSLGFFVAGLLGYSSWLDYWNFFGWYVDPFPFRMLFLVVILLVFIWVTVFSITLFYCLLTGRDIDEFIK